MDRRRFIAVLGGVLVGPRAALAVPAKRHRIAFFTVARGANVSFLDALRAGLRDHGFIEGRNIEIAATVSNAVREKLEAVCRDIIASRPDVIVAAGGPAALALYRLETTIPVVFAVSSDPAEAGLVQSLGRPGGNFTGMTWLSLELVGKRLEMLKDVLPHLRRVAVLANPHHPGQQQEKAASERAAGRLGLEIRYHEVRNFPEIARAFEVIRRDRSEAVDVYPEGLTLVESARIAALANQEGLASISGWAEYADAGFLMSYGPNRRDSIRRLAAYVNRILRGAPPADLPVELPRTVETVVNLNTARALGIAMPHIVLLRADRVIE